MSDMYQPAASDSLAAARPQRRSRLGRFAMVTAASALALGAVAVAVVPGAATAPTATAASSTDTSLATPGAQPDIQAWREALAEALANAGYPDLAQGGTSTQGGSTQEDATEASSTESTGVVLIDTVLGYEGAAAAGTGMVLTSDGLILTNHHVIEGATEIRVTLATGETYDATVVGSDATNDVALLQLDGASGLTTVTIDDDEVGVGDAVTAVGNASGGGVLMAADGSVTQLDSSVTTAAEYSTASETLDGMIQFSADVVSGDSGGALIDDEGEVVGMTTAASTGYADTVAFAVPIDDALAIAQQIIAGDESGTVTVGYSAFLGIALGNQSAYAVGPDGRLTFASATAGASIGYVYAGTPAEELGLEAGDIVTAVDGTAVTSGDDLAAALAGYEPGDSVTLTWTDAAGATQTGSAELIAGPAA